MAGEHIEPQIKDFLRTHRGWEVTVRTNEALKGKSGYQPMLFVSITDPQGRDYIRNKVKIEGDITALETKLVDDTLAQFYKNEASGKNSPIPD